MLSTVSEMYYALNKLQLLLLLLYYRPKTNLAYHLSFRPFFGTLLCAHRTLYLISFYYQLILMFACLSFSLPSSSLGVANFCFLIFVALVSSIQQSACTLRNFTKDNTLACNVGTLWLWLTQLWKEGHWESIEESLINQNIRCWFTYIKQMFLIFWKSI